MGLEEQLKELHQLLKEALEFDFDKVDVDSKIAYQAGYYEATTFSALKRVELIQILLKIKEDK